MAGAAEVLIDVAEVIRDRDNADFPKEVSNGSRRVLLKGLSRNLAENDFW